MSSRSTGIRVTAASKAAFAQQSAAFAPGGRAPLRVRGTPTDCIIMGARHLLSGKGPDLVLSGGNCGSNVGEDVIYSGTVAGAVEGTCARHSVAGAVCPKLLDRSAAVSLIGKLASTLGPTSLAASLQKCAARRAYQCQFSRLSTGGGQTHCGNRPGAPRAGAGHKSMRARTAEEIPTIGSPTDPGVQ